MFLVKTAGKLSLLASWSYHIKMQIRLFWKTIFYCDGLTVIFLDCIFCKEKIKTTKNCNTGTWKSGSHNRKYTIFFWDHLYNVRQMAKKMANYFEVWVQWLEARLFLYYIVISLNQEQDCVITFVYFKIKNDRKSSGEKISD